MKKIKLLGASLILMVALIIVTFAGNFTQKVSVHAEELLQEESSSVYDLFSKKKIETTGYLFNYDESADYIYVDFADSTGYAVFTEETMELLEYTTVGNFPYKVTDSIMYYGGPSAYYTKSGEQFVNTITNEQFSISAAEAEMIAESTRQAFSIEAKFDIDSKALNEVPSEKFQNFLSRGSSKKISKTALKGSSNSAPTNPPLDRDNWISPTAGATYIPNSAYFLTAGQAPMHGTNNGVSCTTVATQLMLSYNNYYNDRRIIAPQHLHGGWNNATGNGNIFDPSNYTIREWNPNVSTNPNSMTSQTLGANQAHHDMLFNNNITGFLSAAEGNLRNHLNTRGINFTVDSQTATTLPFGLGNFKTIASTNILGEINAGRPLVLATADHLNGTGSNPNVEDFNHSVIAYGHQTFAAYADSGNTTKYLGYIVHLGWDSSGNGSNINIWTNSAWYYSYLTLQINHTHGYYDTGITVGSKRELRCSECNHRIGANITTITTAQQLSNIRNSTTGYYKLGNNITLSGQWTTIPNFYGVLDGNNFSINNTTFDIPDTKYTKAQCFGLFGFLFGTVSNLSLQNVTVTGGIRHDGEWVDVGGIAGHVISTGKIENSSVSGSLHTRRLNCNTGGIAGANHGTISNCTNTATLYTNGDTGGIAGRSMSTGTITNSINSGDVSFYLSSAARSVGGIIGLNEGTVTNNQHRGQVRATNTINLKACMGTIIGHHRTSTAFSTTNTVNGGTYIMPSYTSGNNVYLFAQHSARVGRVG